jgi:hypothetical protein
MSDGIACSHDPLLAMTECQLQRDRAHLQRLRTGFAKTREVIEHAHAAIEDTMALLSQLGERSAEILPAARSCAAPDAARAAG